MKEPVGIESGNVRASACRDDDWCLSLSHHAVISLDLCFLPLGHLSLLLYLLQIYAKLPCFHGSLDFLQGCSSVFGRIPRRLFFHFLVKTDQNRSNQLFASLKTVPYPQNQVLLPTISTGNGNDQERTIPTFPCPSFGAHFG